MSSWEEVANEPPRAVVQRIGQWTYLVRIDHGLLTYGPGGYGWHVWGRRRAYRKAKRVYAKFVRNRTRCEDVTTSEFP